MPKSKKPKQVVLECSLPPNGAHRLILLDDSKAAGNRIYRIESNTTATVIEGKRIVDAVHMTGEEIEGLWNAYMREKKLEGYKLHRVRGI